MDDDSLNGCIRKPINDSCITTYEPKKTMIDLRILEFIKSKPSVITSDITIEFGNSGHVNVSMARIRRYNWANVQKNGKKTVWKSNI